MEYFLVIGGSVTRIDQCNALTRFPFVHPDEDDMVRANPDELEIWHSLSDGKAVVALASDAAEALALSNKYHGLSGALENVYCMKCDCHHSVVCSAEL